MILYDLFLFFLTRHPDCRKFCSLQSVFRVQADVACALNCQRCYKSAAGIMLVIQDMHRLPLLALCRAWADIACALHCRKCYWIAADIMEALIPYGSVAVEAQTIIWSQLGAAMVESPLSQPTLYDHLLSDL